MLSNLKDTTLSNYANHNLMKCSIKTLNVQEFMYFSQNSDDAKCHEKVKE